MSKRYSPPTLRLAKAANQSGGFPCVVVYAQDDVPELCDPHILPIRIEPPLLPDRFWCNASKMNPLWGWARAQLYKTYALASLLREGFDVLLLDADHRASADPMPTLRKARAQGLDVVAQAADFGRGYLNFGVSWTRASPRTSALAQRLHNRSFRGWDQYLWNVEIGAADLACCQHKQLPIIRNRQPRKQLPESAYGAHGELLCEEPDGPSLGPPQGLRHKLGPTRWNPSGYNTLGWHRGRFGTTCMTKCEAEPPESQLSPPPLPSGVSFGMPYAAFIKEMVATIAAAPYVATDQHSVAKPLRQALQAVPGGLVAEFGVFKGNTLKTISAICGSNCHVFAFDSFQGLPSKWRDGPSERFEKRYTGKGAFSLGGQVPRLGLKNVAYSVGLFNETLPSFLAAMASKKAAFIHVDSHLYASAKDVLCSFVQRDAIANGTVVVFDELIGFPEFPVGEMKALYDCFESKRGQFEVKILERSVKDVKESYSRETWPQSVAVMIVQRLPLAPPPTLGEALLLPPPPPMQASVSRTNAPSATVRTAVAVVSLWADPMCLKRRFASLAGVSNGIVLLDHKVQPALLPLGVKALLQPQRPAWASPKGMYGGTSKWAKLSFVIWLASSQYDFAWHLEDDVGVAGNWSELVQLYSNDTESDLIGQFNFDRKHGYYTHGCTVCGPKAGITKWPVLRMSRKLAEAIVQRVCAGEDGHHEAFALAACAMMPKCQWRLLEHARLYLLMGSEHRDMKQHKLRFVIPADPAGDVVFHPVKCDPSRSTGVKKEIPNQGCLGRCHTRPVTGWKELSRGKFQWAGAPVPGKSIPASCTKWAVPENQPQAS